MPNKIESSSASAIEFLRTRSLTNVVQAEIERMIIDGEVQPNERINENALSQRLGVSRGPVREACSALSAIGLVEVIPNRGFFVRALSNDEAQDLSEARASVFGSMAMMAAERVTESELAMLKDLVERMEKLADTGEVREYYPINLEFHRQIGASCGNRRLAQIYQSFVRELHIQRYRALSSGAVLHISNSEHRAIVEALAARDPLAALVAARTHILNGIVRTRRAGEPSHSGKHAKTTERKRVGRQKTVDNLQID